MCEDLIITKPGTLFESDTLVQECMVVPLVSALQVCDTYIDKEQIGEGLSMLNHYITLAIHFCSQTTYD